MDYTENSLGSNFVNKGIVTMSNISMLSSHYFEKLWILFAFCSTCIAEISNWFHDQITSKECSQTIIRRGIIRAIAVIICFCCSYNLSYADTNECKKINSDMIYYINARIYKPSLADNQENERLRYCNSPKIKSLVNNFDNILVAWSKEAESCKYVTPNLYPALKQFRELHKSVTGICSHQ